jgi:cell division protease FtsH
MARAMVTQYGMSDSLGPRVYGDKQELVFLGREISEQRDYSDAVAEQIDREVRSIIDEEHTRANQILQDHRDKLDLVAKKLLEVETLEAEEFVALIVGTEVPSQTPQTRQPPTSSKNEPAGQVEWKPTTVNLPPAPSPA